MIFCVDEFLLAVAVVDRLRVRVWPYKEKHGASCYIDKCIVFNIIIAVDLI